MRNLYFVQINDIYQSDKKNTYIPYAAGCIEAYCLQNPVIAEAYRFGKIVYCRDEINRIVSRFEDPFMVFFSCSVWNTQFNLALAAAVKKAYPSCYVTIGGHQVSSDPSYLERYEFIDFITHRAGEEPTEGLLVNLTLKRPLDGIPNLSFRNEKGEIVTTPEAPQTGTDYPSPYLTGVFDELLEDDVEFSILFETNRGCPNSCAFCDWGALRSKVRLFPLEKVFAEIDWFVEHKIDYIYCADANFCLFDRDGQIVDYIIDCSRKYGYPKHFHVNFTKNKLDFVFEVSTKMVRSGLSKAQTISFQSMNPEVLQNVGRRNMSAEHFKELMRRFSEHGVATYCELILGLPGETYDSFCDGICALLENGQHFAINVYPCELLPNSRMGNAAYQERYGIRAVDVPFRLMHATGLPGDDAVTEYARFITSTYSMDEDSWVRALVFASYVQGFHNLGALRAAAIYCRYEHGIPYLDFYGGLLRRSEELPDSLLGRIFLRIRALCRGVTERKNAFAETLEGTDNVLWGFDELTFLYAYREFDLFYEEIGTWLATLIGDDPRLGSLTAYQKDLLKKIGQPEVEIVSDYDFYGFFRSVYLNEPRPLERKNIRLRITDPSPVGSFAQFARETVWYGRNRRESDYTGGHYEVRLIGEPDPDATRG